MSPPDFTFTCNSLTVTKQLSAIVPTYMYEFRDENAPAVGFPNVGFPYEAYHSAEIQYIMNPGSPFTVAQQGLSAQMVSYWSAFAASGAPGGAGSLAWNPYNGSVDQFQALAPDSVMAMGGFYKDHHCAFWANYTIPR